MEADIWTADPSPAVARIEAAFSDALLNYLYRVHVAAHRELGLPGVEPEVVRAAYQLPPGAVLAKADVWSKAAQLFARLIQQPRQARSARDMARAVTDHWFERGLIEDAALKAVVQANVIGAVEAGRDPARVEGWRKQAVSLTESGDGALQYGMQRAAEHVTRVRDTTRSVLAGAVTDALLRGDSPQQLASDLTQRFGTLNRDARRLAITEVAFARANGLLTQSVGKRARWFAAEGACPACEHFDGREFEIIAGPGDPDTQVWPGKHNAGLKAAERVPAIPYHPNCRCKWVLVAPPIPGVSKRMLAALAALDDA